MKKSLFAGFLLCGLVLTACGGDSNSTDGSSTSGSSSASGNAEQVFNLAVVQEMPSADLSLATDTISFAALNNVYEGLYRLDADQAPSPAGAAEMAEISDDGLVYTLQLREDATWSNGDPLTADDYVYGWQRTVDPATASQYAYLYSSVANATAITEDGADVSTLGIKALSDYELEITLEVATPYFDYLLAFPSFFPQHEATVEEYGTEYAQTSDKAVYNGPFVLADFDGPGTDTEWTYQKNDNYWDADNVALDTINVSVIKESSTALNLFNDGQLNDVTLTGELAQQNAGEDAYVVDKSSRTTYIEMNQREADSPWHNQNLRMALSYAIDREMMVQQVLGNGSVASTSLIPSEMSYNPDTGEDFVADSKADLEYDLEQAQSYWEAAKSELGIDSLSFELLADDTDSTKAVAQYLQGAWQDAFDGMSVSIATVPFSVRIDRANTGDFEVVLGGWGADYSDPSSFTDLFVTDNTYNRGHWSNSEYDTLVTEAATTNANDPEARWQNLVDAEAIISGEMGVIPVFQKAEGHLRSTNVKNVVVHGAGASYDYKWAYIE
ncbi:peptide ABC transporter substrate-binding protein [Enterococcus sp. HY326]|uniref:peptide ABC transporter substrate-binding protein n=1 Tax=Enterococcus sp. HY326 TaxID=2971265 RepID=UPI002240C985|nr:peptide ABC transporter substrate-binding protein [Enterococcus sp. HY326]